MSIEHCEAAPVYLLACDVRVWVCVRECVWSESVTIMMQDATKLLFKYCQRNSKPQFVCSPHACFGCEHVSMWVCACSEHNMAYIKHRVNIWCTVPLTHIYTVVCCMSEVNASERVLRHLLRPDIKSLLTCMCTHTFAWVVLFIIIITFVSFLSFESGCAITLHQKRIIFHTKWHFLANVVCMPFK